MPPSSRGRGYCVGGLGGLRPRVWIPGALGCILWLLLRGMGTSSEVADQGCHHLLDNSILAMWDGLPVGAGVVTLFGCSPTL